MQHLTFIPLLIASASMAQVHSGDIVLAVSSGNAITTNASDQFGSITSQRVFEAAFGESPNFTNDPGFDSDNGTFPANSTVGFRIRRALRDWSGIEFSDDDIADERIQVRLGPLGPTLTPTSDVVVTGFSLAANSSGKFHHHLGYTLLPKPGESQPADGVYLLELELFSNQPSIQTSRPFWLVFNQNRPTQEHQAAIDWVNANLVCTADFNADGTVDFFDYLDFVAAFSGNDATADFNADTVIDFFDYLDFVATFSQGCA
ncbi:MAG: hypothetical protein KGS45_06405 [Planctomycetes bacterium]|nr:hypothetical protein [Planctomycetota bacterium]